MLQRHLDKICSEENKNLFELSDYLKVLININKKVAFSDKYYEPFLTYTNGKYKFLARDSFLQFISEGYDIIRKYKFTYEERILVYYRCISKDSKSIDIYRIKYSEEIKTFEEHLLYLE